MEESKGHSSRRDFLKRSILAAAAGAAFSIGTRKGGLPFFGEEGFAEDIPAGRPRFRTLGRTGLKISAVSVGAMNATDPAVIEKAFLPGLEAWP